MNVPAVNQIVLDWYTANARDLPWRNPPFLGNPYAVLVSEVMLQQTQVERTIPKFNEFMKRFPTMRKLSESTSGEVITMWSGMGYNNRAVRLQRLAKVVVAEHAGVVPSSIKSLLALPGIGPYTASAIACFAFDQSVPVIDTNIYRVLSRLVNGVNAPSRGVVEPLAAQFLPAHRASEWHQGLMDIGATLCSVSAPKCMRCPLRGACAAAPALQGGNNPKLAETSVPYKPKQSQFTGSQRFYRGRIVEAVRHAPAKGIPISALHEVIELQSSAQLGEIVGSLVRDGLVVQSEEFIRLP